MNETFPISPLTANDFKSANKPMWCLGCGDYAVLGAVTKSLVELDVKREDVAIVTGIGCSGRFTTHTSVYAYHGVHGRSLAVATGLKVARPDLMVMAVGGDGDGFAIGGNHFIHACRRNIDMTYIVMDNQVYGMTKGQASPTTAADWTQSKLTPEGPGAAPYQALPVALSTGANFIARAFAGNPKETIRIIVEAVRHPGFSFVDILCPCVAFQPEQWGWKEVVRPGFEEPTSNSAEAGWRLLDDDGFNLGVLFKGDRAPFHVPAKGAGNLAGIRRKFAQ